MCTSVYKLICSHANMHADRISVVPDSKLGTFVIHNGVIEKIK